MAWLLIPFRLGSGGRKLFIFFDDSRFDANLSLTGFNFVKLNLDLTDIFSFINIRRLQLFLFDGNIDLKWVNLCDSTINWKVFELFLEKGCNPKDIYLFKANNENTMTMCEICSVNNIYVRTLLNLNK